MSEGEGIAIPPSVAAVASVPVRITGYRCVECPNPKPVFPNEREAWRHIESRHRDFVLQEYIEWVTEAKS